MFAMLVAGRLTNRADPRMLMLCGYVLLGLSIYMQEGWTPADSESYMTLTIIIQGIGLGFVFVPLQVVAFYTVTPELRTQGTALLSLVRNVGSAIGISLTSALLDRQGNYEHAVLTQYITPFDRAAAKRRRGEPHAGPDQAGRCGAAQCDDRHAGADHRLCR